jgi:hypothetical protein
VLKSGKRNAGLTCRYLANSAKASRKLIHMIFMPRQAHAKLGSISTFQVSCQTREVPCAQINFGA